MHAFVMAGGRGLRLTPVSTNARPKPFIHLLDERLTLFQQTLRRLGQLSRQPAIGIIGNRRHEPLIRQQLAEMNEGPSWRWLILEPQPRNTGPAIVLASLLIAGHTPDMPLLFLPADHHHDRWAGFSTALNQALPVIMTEPVIGLFGMPPMAEAHAFGHIVLDRQGAVEQDGAACHPVLAFIEKPVRKLAARLAQTGRVRINAGIVLARAGVIADTAADVAPTLYAACERALDSAKIDETGRIVLPEDLWAQCPDIPFDRAVLERADNLICCPCDSTWQDVGTWPGLWSALLGMSPKKPPRGMPPWQVDGNRQIATRGNVSADNVHRALLWTENGWRLHVRDLENILVIAANGILHVAPLDAPEKEGCEGQGPSDPGTGLPQSFIRTPWGAQACLHHAPQLGVQIKWLRLSPHSRTSLQKHAHRSEWLHVLSGTLRLQMDEEIHILQPGMSHHVPRNHIHRLENPGPSELHVLEVQTGAHLDENDIIRYDDDYGRV